jgi:hypothetical protein
MQDLGKILRFASLDKAQALIIKSVKQRDETCLDQVGRPLTIKPRTNATATDTRRASGTSRRRVVPSGTNPKPAGLGEASWSHCAAARAQLHMEVTSTDNVASKLSINLSTNLQEL